MKVGIVGLDDFGAYALEQLLTKTAYDIYVYQSPFSQCDSASQAYRCRTAAEIFDCCDVVITCMASVEELLALYNSMAFLVSPGQIFLDMTEQGPAQAGKNAAAMRQLGAFYFDCGVFTSRSHEFGASFSRSKGEKRLMIFVGGSSAQYAKIAPLLRCIAPGCTHMGPPGRGQALRLMSGALAYNIDMQALRMARLAERLDIPKNVFYQALRDFSRTAKPLSRLSGGKPPGAVREYRENAALVDEMELRARGGAHTHKAAPSGS